jgi:hypothetical protein
MVLPIVRERQADTIESADQKPAAGMKGLRRKRLLRMLRKWLNATALTSLKSLSDVVMENTKLALNDHTQGLPFFKLSNQQYHQRTAFQKRVPRYVLMRVTIVTFSGTASHGTTRVLQL